MNRASRGLAATLGILLLLVLFAGCLADPDPYAPNGIREVIIEIDNEAHVPAQVHGTAQHASGGTIVFEKRLVPGAVTWMVVPLTGPITIDLVVTAPNGDTQAAPRIEHGPADCATREDIAYRFEVIDGKTGWGGFTGATWDGGCTEPSA